MYISVLILKLSECESSSLTFLPFTSCFQPQLVVLLIGRSCHGDSLIATSGHWIKSFSVSSFIWSIHMVNISISRVISSLNKRIRSFICVLFFICISFSCFSALLSACHSAGKHFKLCWPVWKLLHNESLIGCFFLWDILQSTVSQWQNIVLFYRFWEADLDPTPIIKPVVQTLQQVKG